MSVGNIQQGELFYVGNCYSSPHSHSNASLYRTIDPLDRYPLRVKNGVYLFLDVIPSPRGYLWVNVVSPRGKGWIHVYPSQTLRRIADETG